ncbi:protein kinase family protein [Flavobacterium defluvii]|uniref:Serine/threonine protein kinase n=1 Tax=Flavobacterium defluvii TaxID=370979 RepID=A0A1M5IVB5_9FLAO|nr:protein kinase family protein [Flavobacterium defluvii]SHG32267.1 Serine/threonine protein kinase [Flavobacterium defluvii]
MGDENVDEIIKDFILLQDDIVIDRYSNGGANGELYFGERKLLSDRVALKFYYYNKDVSTHNEPLILKSIEHPNILKIYDAKIIHQQYAYFLTPEISGGDLKNFKDNNIVSFYDAINITQGILNGLSELHKNPNNLLHRDLKPKNILIDQETKTPYIADFGSVKFISNAENSVVASKSTQIYRPNESVVQNVYNRQSDIYQVGIIFFQLLGGKFPEAPFEWLDDRQKSKFLKISGSEFEKWQFIDSAIDNLIVKNKLLDYDSLPAYINNKVKAVIKTATNKDLNKRYFTCSEFIKDLFDLKKQNKDWRIDNQEIYANKENKKYYRISEDKKGYCLQVSKNQVNWTKDNKHDGTLESIISRIHKD